MGFVNGSEIDEIGREFWLPFGLGLGGACFRKADAQVYKRPLDGRNREKKTNYLVLPGSPIHECLLTFPIDHPELSDKDAPDLGRFRSRQLIGVVTIGTTYIASSLCALCEMPKDGEMNLRGESLNNLRIKCQLACDKLFLHLMNRQGIPAPSTEV